MYMYSFSGCMHTDKNVCIRTYMYVRMYVCMYVRTYVRMYVCMYSQIKCVDAYIHIYIYLETSPEALLVLLAESPTLSF